MNAHCIVEMGFLPLVRQRAYSQSQWRMILHDIFRPRPANATIEYDNSDTDSDAGWYPNERDIEQGLF